LFEADGQPENDGQTLRPALFILAEACKLAVIPFNNLNIDGKHTPLWFTVIIPLLGLKSDLS
jgi:hypothetical protein